MEDGCPEPSDEAASGSRELPTADSQQGADPPSYHRKELILPTTQMNKEQVLPWSFPKAHQHLDFSLCWNQTPRTVTS